MRSTSDELARLRAQIDRVQRRREGPPPLPTQESLARLLPDGGLRPGETYAVSGSTSLLLALLAAPSQSGAWCAAVGMPTLGAEAALAHGVRLDRFVLVPSPGSRWMTVASALTEVLPLVAVRPQSRASDAEVSRLSARLRDRGAVLLVHGVWPQAHAMLSLDEPVWEGLGDGHGHLTQRRVTVTVTSRRHPVPRSERMFIPDPSGAVAPAPDVPAPLVALERMTG